MPGTESLTVVFYKGEYRIAHPGLWDGYPEGHGLTALEFIRDQMNYDKFTDKLMKLRELSDADRARIAEMMEDDWRRQYPHLTEDGDGSEILSVVQDGEDGLPLNNRIDSVGDSSYWQWAYVIDFDKGTFEVYRGFNLEKLDPSERFANAKVEEGSRRYPVRRDRDYQPIKFVTSWRLDSLPANEKFLLELLEPDEDCSEAYINRGIAYGAKGDNDRAIADLSKAIEINPKYAAAYYNRGAAYRAKGDNDRAIADYSSAERRDAKDAAA